MLMPPINAPNNNNFRPLWKNALDVNCDECDNDRFVPVFVVKKISALVSPSGQEVIVPIQALKCDSCNHINEVFLKPQTP